jgi:hypothetical protein
MDGNENLNAEGVPPERVHFVGNVMIDTLVRLLPLTDQQPCVIASISRGGLCWSHSTVRPTSMIRRR